MSRTFENRAGLTLAYDDRGAGVPVLCLAGLTRNMADFEPFAAGVAGVRLIRLDTRGRGGSAWHPDPVAGYTVPGEAEDALDLLDHLGIARAVIVGTSRGGIIAMWLAAQAKDRLAGVLLNDIGPVIDGPGIDVIMTYLGRRPAAPDFATLGQALAAVNAAAFPGVAATDWEVWGRRWFVEEGGALGLRYDPALRAAVASGEMAPDLWPLFDALDGVPLAALRGANSDLLSAQTFAAMQARRPDMIAATVPDRGHVPFLDEPEALAAFAQLMERVDV